MVYSADLFSHLFISTKGVNNLIYKDWKHNLNLKLNLPPGRFNLSLNLVLSNYSLPSGNQPIKF